MRVETVLKQRIRDYNRICQELETLWRDNDEPRGKAWEKVAAPLWAEQARVEKALAPLLLEWAEKNGCGQYRDGSGYLSLVDWWPEKDCYKKIVEHTGLKGSSLEIRLLLLIGAWLVRGSKVAQQSRKDWDAFVRSMSDAEFAEYMKDYCTASIEGKNTKDLLLELRAKFKAEQKEQPRRPKTKA